MSSMRVTVGVLVNEIVFPLPNKNSGFNARIASSVISVHLEVSLFGQTKRTRSYGLYSCTSPVLPCEQFHFSKDFVEYTTIAELLRSFEREPFSVHLWIEYSNVPTQSSLRREMVAEYEDNALNVLYPYHTLHPSYDHVSRRLHLNSVNFETKPILARLTLSVALLDDKELAATSNRRPTPTSLDRRSTPRSNGSYPPARPRPTYMEPTFSSLMSEHTTRRHFSQSSSTDHLSNGNGNGLSRIPRSASDFWHREY